MEGRAHGVFNKTPPLAKEETVMINMMNQLWSLGNDWAFKWEANKMSKMKDTDERQCNTILHISQGTRYFTYYHWSWRKSRDTAHDIPQATEYRVWGNQVNLQISPTNQILVLNWKHKGSHLHDKSMTFLYSRVRWVFKKIFFFSPFCISTPE